MKAASVAARCVLLVLLACLGAALAAACGSPSSKGEGEAEAEAQRAFDAINQPGMVFHAKGDDGSEVWIDAEHQLYRQRAAPSAGGLVSVGQGWTRIYYDAFANRVATEDRSPSGPNRPRLDNPAVQWFEPLSALAFGSELRFVGRTTSDGREVIAIEARSPITSNGQFTGSYLIGRVELDPVSRLVLAFERRVQPPAGQNGQTPDPASLQEGQKPERIHYETELIPRDSLPADFFSPTVVEDQVVTLEENLAAIKSLGLDLLWLGKEYSAGRGKLALPSDTEGVIVDPTTAEASFHYALVSAEGGGLLSEAVIIKLGPSGTDFGQPSIQEFAGRLPESRSAVTVRGGPATLYTSILTPADLPCASGGCPKTKAPLYHRLSFTAGRTSVQIETFARVDIESGADQNPYNSEEGIIALAEALSPKE